VIVAMARVELVGPRELFPEALSFLQGRGVLELRAPALPAAARLHAPALGGPPDEEARLEEALRRIDALVARLPPPGALGALAPLPPPSADAFPAALAALEREAETLEARREALVRERLATARFEQLVVALAPLDHTVDAALAPELHGLVLRTDPEAVTLLEAEVRQLTGGVCEVKAKPLDGDTTGVLLVVPRAAGRALTALLFERGVEEVRLPSRYAGRSLVEQLLLLVARGRALPAELAAAEEGFEAFAARAGAALGEARLRASASLARRRAAAGCGETRFAFVVSGYMPAAEVPGLRAAAAAALGEGVALFSRPPLPAEWGDVPVVLENRPAIRPFERLLALVPLPRYGSVDPTPWLALFFPLFFGLVLGDLAFGALGTAVSLALRRSRRAGREGRELATVALWCSLSAAVFGVLFGEAFGELGGHLGLHPLLLDRRRGFMDFLLVALGVGGVHVLVGMALGVATAARGGHAREMVGRASKLLLLVASALAVAAVAGALPPRARLPLVAVVGALLLVAMVAEGPMAALELVLGLGNVLSYSRLMALGLASVMLAEVANGVASGLRPRAAGLALAALLHAVNFTLGLVSPTIAALRLHYVEFFEKFYDPGGAPFRPFRPPAAPLHGAAEVPTSR
jgi:V/A-type H+-transporting ATPase subunit I